MPPTSKFDSNMGFSLPEGFAQLVYRLDSLSEALGRTRPLLPPVLQGTLAAHKHPENSNPPRFSSSTLSTPHFWPHFSPVHSSLQGVLYSVHFSPVFLFSSTLLSRASSSQYALLSRASFFPVDSPVEHYSPVHSCPEYSPLLSSTRRSFSTPESSVLPTRWLRPTP